MQIATRSALTSRPRQRQPDAFVVRGREGWGLGRVRPAALYASLPFVLHGALSPNERVSGARKDISVLEVPRGTNDIQQYKYILRI